MGSGGLRKRRSLAIFEPEHQRAGHIAIGNRCQYAGMARRICEANTAKRAALAFESKRGLASRAPRGRQKLKARPAGDAKLMVGARHRAAPGAAGRQHHIDEHAHPGWPLHGALSRGRGRGTSALMSPAEIFCRPLRRMRRDRAAPDYHTADFLRRHMIDELQERLAGVTRRFATALDLGCHDAALQLPAARVVRCDAGFAFASAAAGVQADEDRLPFADASFDLVVCAGVLDQINDVPGALTLMRRVLKADGLLLAAFTGAGSLATLRDALRFGEQDRPVARLHPQIDVRAAGDLLQRAGFALPVADTERLTVRYANVLGLMHDLRQMAAGNMAVEQHPMRRGTLARVAGRFAAMADVDGRTRDYFDIIFLTAWSPADDQPRPARRGNGTVSLAAALRPPGPPTL